MFITKSLNEFVENDAKLEREGAEEAFLAFAAFANARDGEGLEFYTGFDGECVPENYKYVELSDLYGIVNTRNKEIAKNFAELSRSAIGVHYLALPEIVENSDGQSELLATPTCDDEIIEYIEENAESLLAKFRQVKVPFGDRYMSQLVKHTIATLGG